MDQFFLFKEWVKAGGIRQALSALKQLIETLVKGFFRYIWLGIKELGTRIKRFAGWVKRSIIFFLGHTWTFITKTFPNVLKRTLIGFWNNLHWLGLIAVILFIIMVDIPIPTSDPLVFKVELLIIISFFFCLGVLYPQRDRVLLITKRIQHTVLAGVISAYSMLSGTKINVDQSVFCSRCLRGVATREFQSLMEIKGMLDPPCPFCGCNNWIGSEHVSIPIDKLKRKEEQVIQTTQKLVVKDTLPSKIIISNSDKKALEKGKFPNFPSYQRAQNVGAQTYSELEYIDRLEAPDFETAEKISKGGFAHFETYKKALAVGASSVSELSLVEDLHAPDLATAEEIQKGEFPDYGSYQRAQEFGVKNYSDLQYIDRYGAPDFETAEKIRIGGFSDFETFEKAQSVGASNISELHLIEDYQAPDLVTAKEIQQGQFPDFQSYKQGQDLGVKRFSDLKLIKRFGAPDFDTVTKIRKGGFPNYKSYQQAQKLGARTYSELKFMISTTGTARIDVEPGLQAVVTEEPPEKKHMKSIRNSTEVEIKPVPKIVQEAEISPISTKLITSEEAFRFTEDRKSLKHAIEIIDEIFSDPTSQPKDNQEFVEWNKKKSWFKTQRKRFLSGRISAGMFYTKIKYLKEELLTTFRIPEERFLESEKKLTESEKKIIQTKPLSSEKVLINLDAIQEPKICPQCQYTNESKYTFCMNCGFKLPNSTNAR